MASVGERLSRARVQAFMGRDEELGRFGEALAGDPQAPFAFYVYGPGGIGKSTLLRRLADHARAAGRLLVELDGRFVSRDPADFERAAGPFLDVPGTVLFVDSFEHCQWLESWLWHHFLPRAADDALVVLAGRRAPQPQWAADPAWSGLLHVTELEPFSAEQARAPAGGGADPARAAGPGASLRRRQSVGSVAGGRGRIGGLRPGGDLGAHGGRPAHPAGGVDRGGAHGGPPPCPGGGGAGPFDVRGAARRRSCPRRTPIRCSPG